MAKKKPVETEIPTPVEISDATLTFPANAMSFMPAMEDIPEAFRTRTEESAPWRDLQDTWFAKGLSHYFAFVPVGDLDGNTITRQLSAIQGSYAPKHEHKVAAVSWLASVWMQCVCYGPKDCAAEDLKTIGEGFPLEEYVAQQDALRAQVGPEGGDVTL